MNIYDRARQMCQQSRRPMEMSEALSILARRPKRRVIATVPANSPQQNAHLNTIETPLRRLPYRDD